MESSIQIGRKDLRRGNTPRDALFPPSFPYQLRGRRGESKGHSTDEAVSRPGRVTLAADGGECLSSRYLRRRRVREPWQSPLNGSLTELLLVAFVANGSHDFTDGPDDSIRSFFGHAVAAVGHQHLASSTGTAARIVVEAPSILVIRRSRLNWDWMGSLG